MRALLRLSALAAGVALAATPGPAAQLEVAPGTRFMVELRDKLEARKAKKGKKFEARTVEPLRAADGSMIDTGAKLKGRVSYADHDKLMLRFEEIDTRRAKSPLVASVVGVHGERDVQRTVGKEGEIRADSDRGRNAAIGAAVLGGVGAAVGGARAGGKGAAIGAGSGAAAGAAIGAASGGRDLVLDKGTRLELVLERPLVVRR